MAEAQHEMVSLREYVDIRFSAMGDAVLKAENAAEKRFEGVNEFRKQLGDQARTFMPRLESEEKFRSMEKMVTDLAARVNAKDNQSRGKGEVFGWIFGASGIALAVIEGFALFRK
jgi:hypothetical protein